MYPHAARRRRAEVTGGARGGRRCPRGYGPRCSSAAGRRRTRRPRGARPRGRRARHASSTASKLDRLAVAAGARRRRRGQARAGPRQAGQPVDFLLGGGERRSAPRRRLSMRRHLELGLEDRQRGAQLVAGVGDEALLALERGAPPAAPPRPASSHAPGGARQQRRRRAPPTSAPAASAGLARPRRRAPTTPRTRARRPAASRRRPLVETGVAVAVEEPRRRSAAASCARVSRGRAPRGLPASTTPSAASTCATSSSASSPARPAAAVEPVALAAATELRRARAQPVDPASRRSAAKRR